MPDVPSRYRPVSTRKVPTGFVRVELPVPDHERLRAASAGQGISIAAYARQAVMLKLQEDEHRARRNAPKR